MPHALALSPEFGYLYVADREHGRILCYHAANGSFHKEYKSDIIGGAIYSVDYAQEKLFLINGPDSRDTPIRGFIIDLKTDKIISEFAPNGPMARPHDIAVTRDGLEIYVVELDTNRVTRFDQGMVVFLIIFKKITNVFGIFLPKKSTQLNSANLTNL